MDGVIRRLNKQEKISYTPYEMYFRYGLLALLSWSFITLILRISKWRKQGFAINYSKKSKIILGLIVSVFLSLIWLFVVPGLAEFPLKQMPVLQPDLGYALIIGAILGVCSGLVEYFIKSLKANNMK